MELSRQRERGFEKRTRGVCKVVATLCVLLSCALGARADSGGPNGPPGYDEAVSQALSELEANNYPEAREEFRRAHALFPNARTLRGLGMVEFELRNYGECVQLLQLALASDVRPLDDKLRADTESLLVRARRYLGEVHVETDPLSATVIVDGTHMELREGGSILLEVGEHTLEVRAPGHAPEKRLVQVKGGERTQLQVVLDPLSSANDQRAPTGAPGRPSDLQPLYKKWWLWTIVAAVAVGAGTTAAVLLSRNERDKTPANGGEPKVHLQTLTRF